MSCVVYAYRPARKSLLMLHYSSEGCLAYASGQRLYIYGRNSAKRNKSCIPSSLAGSVENFLQDFGIQPSVEEVGFTALKGKHQTRKQLGRISKSLRRYVREGAERWLQAPKCCDYNENNSPSEYPHDQFPTSKGPDLSLIQATGCKRGLQLRLALACGISVKSA